MSLATIKPSPRLQRAAEAERDELRKTRQQLLSKREEVLAGLHELEGALAEVRDRETLLDRLAPATATKAAEVEPGAASDAHELLRGPSIRETAVRVLTATGGVEAIHYREWFKLLGAAGYSVAGKDPLAVFLTQISRSPVVRKGTQAGVYELDLESPARLRRELNRLQGELRDLADEPQSTLSLAQVRSRRERVTTTIGRLERELEEAERVLREACGQGKPVAVAV
jgi:chromosome segregation ATPase